MSMKGDAMRADDGDDGFDYGKEPRPEAREEDIDALIHDLEYAIPDDYEGSSEFQERRRTIVRAALSRLAAKEGNGRSQQARIENLRESLVIADARMTKQLSGKLMSVTLIGYLSQIQQDIRAAIKADNEAAAPTTSGKPKEGQT